MPRKVRRDRNGNAWRIVRRKVLASEDFCALCGRPVDKTLPPLHPFAAQVDHITPVSKGGALLERNNLQLTHRSCNRRKGDGPKPPPAMPNSRAW
jgi:5-methylcytosine-specific restriction endonuclease McrA